MSFFLETFPIRVTFQYLLTVVLSFKIAIENVLLFKEDRQRSQRIGNSHCISKIKRMFSKFNSKNVVECHPNRK